MKKILVLGGVGFLGKHLIEQANIKGIKADYFDIKAVGKNKKDKLELRTQDFKGYGAIYDFAGVLGTHETFEIAEKAVEVNILGTLNVLEQIKDLNIPYYYITLGNNWLNPYSITKNAASNFCLMYLNEYGTPVQVVKTYNAYGPYQKLFPVRKIVPTFMYKLIKDEEIVINGDGNQIVDLVYAPDLAKSLLKNKQVGVVHYGSAKPLTVKQAVEACAKSLGISDYKLKFVPKRMGESLQSTSLSPRKMEYSTPLEKGLNITSAWYKGEIKKLI